MKRAAIAYPIICICLCCIIIVFCYCCWWGSTTTVIIVRHAEKADSGTDPPLTAAGEERAQTLAHVIDKVGIDAIFATEYLRTQQTVQPTSDNVGIAVQIVSSASTDALVDAILDDHKGEGILVAGHSNTVTDIMAGLGISSPPVVSSSEYDNLFVVHIRHYCCGYEKLTHLQYGEPSP